MRASLGGEFPEGYRFRRFTLTHRVKITQQDLGQEFVAKTFGKTIPSVLIRKDLEGLAIPRGKSLAPLGQFFA